MVQENRAPLGTAFTVSIEAKRGVTTGISAADRARTIKVAVDENSGPRRHRDARSYLSTQSTKRGGACKGWTN